MVEEDLVHAETQQTINICLLAIVISFKINKSQVPSFHNGMRFCNIGIGDFAAYNISS